MEIKLSEYQQKIKDFYDQNPRANILVRALAGSAKTFIILELAKNTTTSDLYVAFNKSIQTEMAGKITNHKLKCYTMHALGFSVMRYNLELQQKNPIVDAHKTLILSERAIRTVPNNQLQKSGNDGYSASEYIEHYKGTIDALYNACIVSCADIHSEGQIQDVISTIGFFSRFSKFPIPGISLIKEWLRMIDNESNTMFEEKNICSFTEMLSISFQKILNNEWQIPYWLKFTNIFGDEIQDWNNLQQRFIKLFIRPNGRFVLVGDENQAIYLFNAADSHAINHISHTFAPITEFNLPVNYRCGIKILDYVNDQWDIGIKAWENAPQGNVSHIQFKSLCSSVNEEDFVLSRYNADLIALIPNLVKNQKRVYYSDPDVVSQLINMVHKMSSSQTPVIHSEIKEILQEYQDKKIDSGLTSKEEREYDVYRSIFYLLTSYLENNSGDKEDFCLYIQNLINTKDPTNCVRLSSIHKSKGLEADNVYVLHSCEPQYELARSGESYQQETNLSYVAATRAKNNLYLVSENTSGLKNNEDLEF